MNNSTIKDRLPLVGDISRDMRLSLVVVVLMTGLSLAGLLWSDSLYPSKEMFQSFLANDVVNLLIGLPILLGALWLTQRDLLVGLPLWPGAL